MFDVGDRVRVVKFFGTRTNGVVGVTGTVTKVVDKPLLTYADPRNKRPENHYAMHVKMDAPQKAMGTWSKAETITMLFYFDELEYEDNRQGWPVGEILGYNLDYVRLNNGMSTCLPLVKDESPLFHVFKLFANVRVGDTGVHVTCLGCGDVIGTIANSIGVDDIDNIMYMNNQPSLENEQGRRLE